MLLSEGPPDEGTRVAGAGICWPLVLLVFHPQVTANRAGVLCSSTFARWLLVLLVLLVLQSGGQPG